MNFPKLVNEKFCEFFLSPPILWVGISNELGRISPPPPLKHETSTYSNLWITWFQITKSGKLKWKTFGDAATRAITTKTTTNAARAATKLSTNENLYICAKANEMCAISFFYSGGMGRGNAVLCSFMLSFNRFHLRCGRSVMGLMYFRHIQRYWLAHFVQSSASIYINL